MDRNGGEVVVVGAGILGCSIAVHLVERGLRPVLIDPERPGQGTSTGSFASISAFGKDPADYYQLACAGMSGWPRFANRLGREIGLRRAGELRWTSDPEQGKQLARKVADARGRGYPIRLIDQAELARLLPDARLGSVTAACFAPNDGLLRGTSTAVGEQPEYGGHQPAVRQGGALVRRTPRSPARSRPATAAVSGGVDAGVQSMDRSLVRYPFHTHSCRLWAYSWSVQRRASRRSRVSSSQLSG